MEAYLRAGAPLSSIRLSRTVDVDAAYDPNTNAVRGARVFVDRLAADSTVDETVAYAESDSTPGLYIPVDSDTVRSQTTYQLRVETQEGTEIEATTTVPGPIAIVEAENTETVYQSEENPAFTVAVDSRSNTAQGRGRQNVFTFTTTSLLDFDRPETELREQLTPFYRDGYDPEDDDIEDLRTTSSGLLNEGNFERNENGTITVDLPWLAVAFYGPNEAAVSVVDENYYDLLRSQQVQQGGFAPGEIPNVIENVEGGTGVFGSYARATQQIDICPPTGCS